MSELLWSPIRANSSSGISDEKTSSKIGLRRALQVLLDGGSQSIAIDVRLTPDEFPRVQRRPAIPCDGCGQGRKVAADSGSFLERHQPYFITSFREEVVPNPPRRSITFISRVSRLPNSL